MNIPLGDKFRLPKINN